MFSPPKGNLGSRQISAHPHPVQEAGGEAQRASSCRAAQLLGGSFLPLLQESCAVQATGWLKESRRLMWITHKAFNIQPHIKGAKALSYDVCGSHTLGQNSHSTGKWEQQHSSGWKHILFLDSIPVYIIKREHIPSSKSSALFFSALCVTWTIPESLPSVFLGVRSLFQRLEGLVVYSEVKGHCLFFIL